MLKNALSVCTLRPLLLVMPFMLSACSGLSPSDLSRSSPGPDGEYMGWHCEGVTEGEAESSDNWSCSETLLRDGLVLSEIPRPDQVEASVENTLVAKAPIRKAPIRKASVKKALATRFPKFDISGNGYTVQLGAFGSQIMAERAADNIMLPGGELRIRDIISGERQLFVVVYGQYQTPEQAEVATEPLVVLNSGLNYWIRSIASMGKRD
jgi:septal ring-binding cell division protein DamX